jgi:hypothetical protein
MQCVFCDIFHMHQKLFGKNLNKHFQLLCPNNLTMDTRKNSSDTLQNTYTMHMHSQRCCYRLGLLYDEQKGLCSFDDKLLLWNFCVTELNILKCTCMYQLLGHLHMKEIHCFHTLSLCVSCYYQNKPIQLTGICSGDAAWSVM